MLNVKEQVNNACGTGVLQMPPISFPTQLEQEEELAQEINKLLTYNI